MMYFRNEVSEIYREYLWTYYRGTLDGNFISVASEFFLTYLGLGRKMRDREVKFCVFRYVSLIKNRQIGVLNIMRTLVKDKKIISSGQGSADIFR